MPETISLDDMGSLTIILGGKTVPHNVVLAHEDMRQLLDAAVASSDDPKQQDRAWVASILEYLEGKGHGKVQPAYAMLFYNTVKAQYQQLLKKSLGEEPLDSPVSTDSPSQSSMAAVPTELPRTLNEPS